MWQHLSITIQAPSPDFFIILENIRKKVLQQVTVPPFLLLWRFPNKIIYCKSQVKSHLNDIFHHCWVIFSFYFGKKNSISSGPTSSGNPLLLFELLNKRWWNSRFQIPIKGKSDILLKIRKKIYPENWRTILRILLSICISNFFNADNTILCTWGFFICFWQLKSFERLIKMLKPFFLYIK